MKNCFLFIFIKFCAIAVGFGQSPSNEVIPAQFQQFFKTFFLINPASIGTNSMIEINTGENSMTGSFKGIHTFYANCNISFKGSRNESSKYKHVFGLSFINDTEGSYIKRSRGNLLYAVHIPIKSDYTLNGGASAGFINYSYDPSNIGGGGSAFAFNSDVGVWLHSSTLDIGLSVNQLAREKLKPLGQYLFLKRHINISGKKKLEVNYDFTLMPTFNLRWINTTYYTLDLACLGILQKTLIAGVGYRFQKGISVMGGVEKIEIGEHIFKFIFTYYTPFSRSSSFNPQTVELSLNYYPQKKKKLQEY